MPPVPDFGNLFREAFDAVRWREPGGSDAVGVEEFQQAIDTDCSAVDASRDVRWVLRGTIDSVDPIGHGVDVDAVAD